MFNPQMIGKNVYIYLMARDYFLLMIVQCQSSSFFNESCNSICDPSEKVTCLVWNLNCLHYRSIFLWQRHKLSHHGQRWETMDCGLPVSVGLDCMIYALTTWGFNRMSVFAIQAHAILDILHKWYENTVISYKNDLNWLILLLKGLLNHSYLQISQKPKQTIKPT